MNNSDTDYYCYSNVSNEYYSQIFTKHLTIGSKLGFVASITSSYNPFKIISAPCLNRAVGIGESNIVEEFYYPTFPTNYSNIHTTNVENPIYRGIARVNKFIYNMWISNNLMSAHINLPTNSHYPKKLGFNSAILTKLFIEVTARSGSEVIGAIEKNLPDPVTKCIYTGMVFSSIFIISSIFSPSISFESKKGTFLSQQAIAKVSIGFIASYLVLDAYHLSEIGKEFADFSIATAVEKDSIKIISEFHSGNINTLSSLINTVTIYALSKGIGITLTEVADNYIGLSEFISDSIQSGVTLITESYENMSLSCNLFGLVSIDDFDII